MNKEIIEHVNKIKADRAQYIEMFAAAFLLETGTEEASKYRLVETVTYKDQEMITVWEFVPR